MNLIFAELLSYQFMQRAFLAGTIVAILCPTIGVFLVLKRLSMVGETLAHVSLAGVLAGFFFKLNPIPAALITAIITAFGIEKVRLLFKNYGEIALAIFASAGLGLAVILFNIVKESDASVQSLLFGSIVSLSQKDVSAIWILGLVVLLVVFIFFRQFFFLTFDEEGAKLLGINIGTFNYLLLIMTSCIVAIGMRIIGALLISSLFVLPVACSLMISRNFKMTILVANLVSIFSVYLGIILSYFYDLAPGGAIIVALIGVMLSVYLIRGIVMLILNPQKSRAERSNTVESGKDSSCNK
jgi:zinc transport system permease protein